MFKTRFNCTSNATVREYCELPDHYVTLKEKLEARKTINAFRACHTRVKKNNPYGLIWGGCDVLGGGNKTIRLFTVNWNYFMIFSFG